MHRTSFALLAALVATPCLAQRHQNLDCVVTKKVSAEMDYTTKMLNEQRPSVQIRALGNTVQLQRCGLNHATKVPGCDPYVVDRVEFTPGVNIVKYYVFLNQFDVQLFPNGSFIENMGRGLISFGTCIPAP